MLDQFGFFLELCQYSLMPKRKVNPPFPPAHRWCLRQSMPCRPASPPWQSAERMGPTNNIENYSIVVRHLRSVFQNPFNDFSVFPFFNPFKIHTTPLSHNFPRVPFLLFSPTLPIHLFPLVKLFPAPLPCVDSSLPPPPLSHSSSFCFHQPPGSPSSRDLQGTMLRDFRKKEDTPPWEEGFQLNS